MSEELDSIKFEEFVRWFLRLNGYFGIENFIVHAADDPERISGGVVAPYTETDTIAVRMRHSQEIAGTLTVANYPPLVDGSQERFDVVIAEAKSGNENRPNKVWRNGSLEPIEYIVRFVGLHKTDNEVAKVAKELSTKYVYEDDECRFRYIVFSRKPNPEYALRGVTYLEVQSVINFLVEVRGQCWIEKNIGVASVHQNWNPLINGIFAIANDQNLDIHERPKLAYRKFLELATKA
jgi:hypothetical protein